MRTGVEDKSKLDPESPAGRRELAQMLIRLFDLWELDTADRLVLLGLPTTSRNQLAKYARGEAAISSGRDTRDRVAHLLAIHKRLRQLYPYNEQLRNSWVRRRNETFNNLRPLDLMAEQGLAGLATVIRCLDAQCEL